MVWERALQTNSYPKLQVVSWEPMVAFNHVRLSSHKLMEYLIIKALSRNSNQTLIAITCMEAGDLLLCSFFLSK